MRAHVAAQKPHILQTHGTKSHLLLCLSGLARRWPWIAFHHGYTQTTTKQEIYNLADLYSLRRATLTVTVTEAFRQQLLRAGVPSSRIRIVPNAVDTEALSGIWRPRSVPPEEPVIVSIGRLSREKAQIDLVEACARLIRSGRRLRVVLAGDGPERDAIRQAAYQLNVPLQLLGQTKDIQSVLASADVFVLPSHSEGAPNALLEAMAAGMPCVATRVGGVPEILDSGREGLLAAAHSPQDLAATIEKMLADPLQAAALGAAGQRRMQQDFSSHARAQRLAAIYAEALRSAPLRP
jgi:glycosyltransferase involved in cell wall biosynthesis